MRRFICISSVPYVVNDGGFRITFRKGDSISAVYTEGDIVHCTTDFGRSFRIPKEDLEKYFERSFDYEEKKYYQQLRDKAAVAAMQGFIINGIDDTGSKENNMKYLVSASVQVATALVEELKATV